MTSPCIFGWFLNQTPLFLKLQQVNTKQCPILMTWQETKMKVEENHEDSNQKCTRNDAEMMRGEQKNDERETNEEAKTIKPIVLRRESKNDFRIFIVNKRLNGGDKKCKKKDILKKKKEYDTSDKVQPLSQPLTPLANTTTTTTHLEESNSISDEYSAEEHFTNQAPSESTRSTPSYDNIAEETNTTTLPVTCRSTANTITENLPTFTVISNVPNTPYNNMLPEEFTTLIARIYEEMMIWRKKLFLVPSGRVGKAFIKLISEWLNRFNTWSNFQGIAMNVIIILPNLLLQKPSSSSNSKEHSKVLDERLNAWNEGKLNKLLRDCKAIQKKLESGKKRTEGDVNIMVLF